MKSPDLDLFYLYTGVHFQGNRAEILESALSHSETRELVWLFWAVNEIPWKRIGVPRRFAAHFLRQCNKASQLAALWRTQTEIILGRPFHVWYVKPSEIPDIQVDRSEEQRWRESIRLRKRQLTRPDVLHSSVSPLC